ncbi:MAG: glycosyltransferase family 2 protein [Terriglobia bacterium]|jgi:glycosyltransferase involved in cell wall biosynthesis|nr:glycosyltransferase family 2 protein [Terriglobia bacterium]
MTAPAASIIVPYFNPGDFLCEAIDSVLAQTFTDWELLLVNDGSTDNTDRLAADFAARDPRIQALSHSDGKNHGLPPTRNLGLRHARGEFIALLDADDVWLPEKLAQQLELARAHPEAAMIFGRSRYWHSWNSGDHEPDSVPELAPGDRLYHPPELWKLSYPFGPFGAPCPSDLLIRRTALDSVGGFEECFDDRAPTHEDIALLSKIFLNFPVYVSSECWDLYRRHDQSIWSRAMKDGSDERSRRFFFEWMRTYLQQHRVTEPEIWRLLDKQTWRYRHPAVYRIARAIRTTLRPLKRRL